MMEKKEALLAKLRSYGSLAVGLSGGVDSSVLAKAAVLALGDRAVAITAVSELLPEMEKKDAIACANQIGIRHVLMEAHDLDIPEVTRNDKERCYYCKKHRFSKLMAWAKENGYQYVADGSNVDDVGDYRPGMRAVEELKVVSPLAECGFGKEDIRELAQIWGLPVWSKPSAACLASRVAYGIPLSAARLQRIEAAETILHRYIAGQLRLRDHGDIARIELMTEDFEKFWAYREEITDAIKKLGYTYVTLDLSGYRMGSQNESLRGK